MLDFIPGFSVKSLSDTKRIPEIPFARHLPYVSLLDDGVIMLRDGDLMASFTVGGINADTTDENRITDLADVMSRLIATQSYDVGYYIHRISALCEPEMVAGNHNEFVNIIDQRWHDYLQTCGLRDRTTMITLTLRPQKLFNTLQSFFDKEKVNRREEIERRVKRLEKIVAAFIASLQDAAPKRLYASQGRWLGLLRALIDGAYRPLIPGAKFAPLSDLIASSDVQFNQDVFTVYGTHGQGLRLGTSITFKDYPSSTFAGILDRLNLPFDTVLSQSFTPIENVAAQGKISRVRRQMQSTEDAAISLSVQLEQAEDDVASGRSIFGDHQATISVFCDDEIDLDDAVTQISRAVQEAGCAMVRENFAGRAAYFSHHPGNYSYRTRAAMISSLNFVDMAAMHSSPTGRPRDLSPWGEAITICPTGRGEPYRFNFHLAGKKDDRTVGHTLVLGQTGSGKTLGTAFLVAQAMRVNPRVIVFDKDYGFEMAIRALDGDYATVKMGEPTGFNPFNAESDERGAAWLTDWLQTLCESNGTQLDAEQIEALNTAVIGNTTADASLQNFISFRSQLRATDDEGDLYTRLARWDEEGQFGWLFNGKDEDSLTFSNDVVAFDLSEIFDNDLIRTAWLSYVFRRIERLVEDERPTLLIMDEAWKLLDDAYFQRRLKDWMLTMRKKNVAVILLTQRVSHIKESAAGNSILESAVTRLVYPSSYNTVEELAPLHLSSNEMDFLRSSNVGNHLALLKSGDDSVVLDLNLAAIGGGIDVLGGGRGAKAREGWRDDPQFWQEFIK